MNNFLQSRQQIEASTAWLKSNGYITHPEKFRLNGHSQIMNRKEILCGIYKITSPSGKIYIGISPDIYSRWRRYKYDKAKRQPKLFASFKKHGVENHTFEVLELCEENILDDKECYYIQFYDTFNTEHGLNLTKGGRGTKGCAITEAQKRAVSIANTGRYRSEELKKRISNSLKERYRSIGHHSKGKKQPASLIAKRVAKNTGRKHTEETKKQMSLSAMGNKRWEGKHHSEETKRKISEANKGKNKKHKSYE